MKRRLWLLAVGIAVALLAGAVALGASSPSVQTGSATNVKQTSAKLLGKVNPNGSPTTFHFEWGLTTSYGVSGSVRSAGNGTKFVSVAAFPSKLIPGTLYHYRLVANNKFGTTFGSDHTFTTGGSPPPFVATGPVTQLGTSSVTLTGVIIPKGVATTYEFQYGLTSFYGVQTFAGMVPAGSAPVIVTARLQGLEPGTTFHYRLVAVHGSNPASDGLDQTFMTFPSPRPVPKITAHTTPQRDRTKPFVFTSSGTVAGPSFIPSFRDCVGSATIRFLLGTREIASSTAALQPNCTFTSQTTFARKPGHGPKNRQVHLRVLVRFGGNGYLAPVAAKAQRITLG